MPAGEELSPVALPDSVLVACRDEDGDYDVDWSEMVLLSSDEYACRYLKAGENLFALPEPIVQSVWAFSRAAARLKLVAGTLLVSQTGFCDLGVFQGLSGRHARALYLMGLCQPARDWDWVEWQRALEVKS